MALSTRYPLALFPIRIETRFTSDGSALRVRMFPDVVHADTHEPPLTPAEIIAHDAWLESTHDLAAWRALHAAVGARRAAYLATLSRADRAAAGTRTEPWTRAPLARLLPAQWTVIATPLGVRMAPIRARTLPVKEPLALGLSPDDPGEVTPDSIKLAEDSAWLASYAVAEQRGMAVTIPIPAGADRWDVVAYGLPDGATPDDELAARGARELTSALAAHRYGEGLGVLAAGTPTNHTGVERPPWSTAAEDPEAGFARASTASERDGDGTSADVLGRAFGVGAAAFARLDGGVDHVGFDRDIAAVHAVLWPATLGYFLEHMLDGVTRDAAQIERVRRGFVEHVRGRGPLPIVRVGRSPYGVLPVTALGPWRARSSELFDDGVVRIVRELRARWTASADRVPRLGADGDGVEQLATILARGPVSTSYVARSVVGPAYATYLYDFIRKPLPAPWWSRQHAVARVGWDAARMSTALPRLARSVFATDDVPLAMPIVVDRAAATEPSLAALLAPDLAALRATPPQAGALAYALARQGLLGAYLSAARSILEARGEPGPFVEPELVGFTAAGAQTPTVSPWTWLDRPAAQGGTETIAALLDRLGDQAPVAAFAGARSAMTRLAGLPAAHVDGLVREALDLCAHRIDAWATAIASARLADLRRSQPHGILVGAYGWVEGLRRDRVVPVREPITGEDGPLRDARGAGHVLAPSLAHAATAALLRSAAIAHAAESAFQIDLESTHARLGREVLDGVRTGLALGAVLGRRFERALVANETPILGDKITAFRRFASLADPNASTDAAREARVVDGHALVMRRGEIPWGQRGLPAAASLERQTIDRIIDELAVAIDATADVLTAETVHQLGAGNMQRAGQLGDAASRGGVPPTELDVLDHRANGIGLEHRVAIVVPAGARATGWATTARARAAPALEAWCAELLGAPERYAARVAFRADGVELATITVTLAALEIAALDVVLGANDLIPRVLDAALHRRPSGVPATAGAEIADVSTLDDARGLGAALARAFAASRPLRADDIAATADAHPALSTAILDDALAALAADPRAGLLAASLLGVAGAVPATDPTAWPAQVTAAIAALTSRRTRLATTTAPDARIGLLVGESLPIAAPLRLATATRSAWTAALAAQPQLVGTDPTILATWLAQLGRARERVGSLEHALMLADIVVPRDDAALDLRVIQTPVEAWIGRAEFRRDTAPTSRSSVVVHAPLGIDPETPLVGLLVDAWSEVVPAAGTTTALAFHYDQPGTQAPQAILLAVPPDDAPAWSEPVIEAILAETIELVHARAVDGELVRDAGHYLPALYLPINLAGETASTDLFPEHG